VILSAKRARVSRSPYRYVIFFFSFFFFYVPYSSSSSVFHVPYSVQLMLMLPVDVDVVNILETAPSGMSAFPFLAISFSSYGTLNLAECFENSIPQSDAPRGLHFRGS